MTPLSEPVNAGGNATITWNFAQDNPGSVNDLYAGSIQDQYQDAIETAINEWSQATGLTFKEVSDMSSSDIRIAWGNFNTAYTGVAGLTFYGDSSNPSDLIELENPLQDALVSNGTNDYDYAGTSVDLTQLALHEIGHTLGLAESSNQDSIMFPELGENNRSLDSQDVAEVKGLYHLSSGTSVTALLKQAAATFDVGGATGSIVTTSHSDAFENPLLAVHAA
ncbi:hypothetical protein AAJCM20276_05190 [Acetobacter aceti]|uniref:Peptidase metallopeptidase domain-containing protein n=2 Tax=Acetobacter aceti TaxID=435 RepID=A0A6S6PGX4_ACEAC|nr:matrixin family metalloprotease [Acetobacter aceti]BCI65895.1 hypothetical protein AAJCM20276_05190 [Acetobacter aceti]